VGEDAAGQRPGAGSEAQVAAGALGQQAGGQQLVNGGGEPAPGRRAELGAQGRAGIARAYAWPRIAARTAAEYRAVLHARTAAAA